MRKFLSKVLTLALVATMVVTGTSITSEAKGKKATNSTATELISIAQASDGLVVGGQNLSTAQLKEQLAGNTALIQTVPGYIPPADFSEWEDPNSEYRHMSESGYVGGMYYQEDIYNDNPLASLDPSVVDILKKASISMNSTTDGAFIYSTCFDNANNMTTMSSIWDSTRGYYTADLTANNLNAKNLAAYMQNNNMVSALDIYNYLVAGGVTFTDDKVNTYADEYGATSAVKATVGGYDIVFKTTVETATNWDSDVTTGDEIVIGDRVTTYEDAGSKFVEQHNTYIPPTIIGKVNERTATVTNTTIQIQDAKTHAWIATVATLTDADGKVTTSLMKIA